MSKIYSENISKNNSSLKPEKETINFLLNYSKSLSILKTDKFVIELNKN